MRWLASIFLLLLPLWCLAPPALPFFGKLKSSAPAPDLTQLAYRWVASDLATNSAISGNWTDEIQGASWLMGANANQPTNSSLGVWFDANHFLTNNGTLLVSSNVSFGFILKILDPGQYSSQPAPFLLDCYTAGVAGGSPPAFGFGKNGSFSATGPLSMYIGDSSAVNLELTANPFPLTNAWCDIIFSQAMTNGNGVGLVSAWTNSISTASYVGETFNSGSGNIGYFGSSHWTSQNSMPRALGQDVVNGSGSKLFLRELWIWTNNLGATGNLLSSTQISNFHYWRTNFYGP